MTINIDDSEKQQEIETTEGEGVGTKKQELETRLQKISKKLQKLSPKELSTVNGKGGFVNNRRGWGDKGQGGFLNRRG